VKLLDWFRRRRREREPEAEQIDEMRRVDEPDQPVPPETYLSQTRD
jgi:DNA-directed RNA polymerase specialized sigma24 family protein